MSDQKGSANKAPETESDDFLGYGVYADTLWARVARALNKDQKSSRELGDDPLVVGLFGEWGSGKSKLLSLIQRRAEASRDESIKARKYDGYEGLLIPVFFQPWKYEHEKHLLVPMLLHILAALEETLAKARNTDDKLTGAALQALGAATGAMSKLVSGVKAAVGVVDPASSAALQVAEIGAAHLAKPKASARLAKQFEHQDNGRSYYEMHRILKAATRPAKRQEIVGEQHHDKDFAVNFVVFIDDLDRCLPENAVGTLELIKTAFNLESFAFVLALDEEVVERGIGHRYQAYVLKDRKPEMPITGFEYLEKIVHLPFRLPALTRAQAADFVRRYEIEREKDGSKRWFSPEWHAHTADELEPKIDMAQTERRRSPRPDSVDLMALALDGFDDIFVPRKLVRMVELMHQIAAVAHERGRPLGWSVGSGAVDVRVVLAIMLIQLFQPELYRLIRRRKTAFSSLLGAFAAQGFDKLDSADVSDHNLHKWALYQQEKLEAITEQSQSMAAEQVRLPLIEQIGQYRRAQRHGFNVLKLMQALAKSMDASGSQPEALVIAPYFSLLGAQANQIQVTSQIVDGENSLHSTVVVGHARSSQAQFTQGTGQVSVSASHEVDTRPRHSPRDLQALFLSLVSPDQAVQANLAGENELPEGQVLEAKAAAELLEKVKAWLTKKEQPRRQQLLMRGLQVLAPYIAHSDGEGFWNLVKDMAHGGELGDVLTSLDQLKAREAWADLRSTFGQDDRFEQAKPWFCRERFKGHDDKQEPLNGFVRIPKGKFTIGNAGQDDNKPDTIEIASDFFMARHLTTVAQYARFVAGDGYKNKDFWDAQGWQWLENKWGSEIEDKTWRAHLDSRSPALRQQPMRWQEQLPHASRPVHGVSWFEARAYCRWLHTQIKAEQDFPKDYMTCLPTEAQWERAARALAGGGAHEEAWVWGAEGKNPELKANISDSKIGRAGVVGLFAPNPLGLADMAGNLWEWQGNLYDHKRLHIQQHLKKDAPLKTAKTWQKSDRPCLRGGSWLNSAGSAQASFRDGGLPDSWSYDVGFRVVLSLAI